MPLPSEHFYENLSGFSRFNEFTQTQQYRPLPADWLVVITDVRGSTAAIEAGQYKEVNAVGVASIAALRNAITPLKIPYVFGGDGATFCIPDTVAEKTGAALLAAKQMARDAFGLTLRVGMVPVASIHDAGHTLNVGKYQPTLHFQQAMFSGSGLGYAETLVKHPAADNPYLVDDKKVIADGSFEGFECRWNEIPGPHEEVMALLVQVLNPDLSKQQKIYAGIYNKITDIYGDRQQYHPLREENIHLTAAPNKLSVEARIRGVFKSGWRRLAYLLKLELLYLAGCWVFYRKSQTPETDWGRYKQSLISNTDFRKFDELLRLVISGSPAQRELLRQYLEELRSNKNIVYGIHTARHALITCLVTDYCNDHIHFLDVSGGGYAMAAKQMKSQLKEI